MKLDERVRSRLTLQIQEFREYSFDETKGILLERVNAAFFPNVWDDAAFLAVAKKASQVKDIRVGLHLLKESADRAEAESKRC